MNDAVNDRDPTGRKLTKEQNEKSFKESFWQHALQYGLQYDIAGRFATANGFTPVCANLLHHGVELLMKARLARDDSVKTIREYGHKNKGYGHDIPRLWVEFKGRRGFAVPAEFDKIIEGLHAFEDIRYRVHLIDHGAMISFGLFDVLEPTCDNGQRPERSYSLQLPQIDRLMGLLFEASGGNPKVFLQEITAGHERFLIYYETLRTTLLGRDTAGTSTRT